MRRVPNERSLGMVFLLLVVTLGFYYLYWLYKTTQDIDEYLGESDIPPIIHLLLFLVTGTLWGFAWDLITARRIMRMQQMAGLPVQDNTILYLVMDILGAGPIGGLGLITMLLEQNSLNEVYRRAGSRVVMAHS